MSFGIGLDLGIASVGWAVLELDSNNEPYRLKGMGSRIFEAAEGERGASLAEERRAARSARRRLRRKARRKQRIRALLVRENIVSKDELERLFAGKLSDIYELRVAALDRLLNGGEFARVLLHLAQRRGFKSNRKSDKTDKETGKILAATGENAALMVERGYRTVGELFYRENVSETGKFYDAIRNGSGDYKGTVFRTDVEREARLIFEKQRDLGSQYASERLETEYLEILLKQLSFDSGPEDGPYSGNIIERMRGLCTLETSVPRAAKASYSFEYFNLLQKLNHIRIGGEPLTQAQRLKLNEYAHSHPKMTFKNIRQELGVPPEKKFNISYAGKDMTFEQCEERERFEFLKAWHEVRKAFDKLVKGHIKSVSRDKLDQIGEAFTIFKTDDKIRKRLEDAGLAAEEITVLCENLSGFTKFGHLSLTALRNIIPFLEQGCTYNEAAEQAGYDFKAHGGGEKSRTISYGHLQKAAANVITSPIVKRTLSQAARVINAIIREQGEPPTYINIELARELAKTYDERRELEQDQKENMVKNELAKGKIREYRDGVEPKPLDIVKLKLFELQRGECPYSGTVMDIKRLFEDGYAQVDHIVPYSVSFDDSYNNKVVVLSRENQHKGNKLPLEYLTGEAAEAFRVRVASSNLPLRKKQNLLKESIGDDDVRRFTERNLTDTKTMSVFLTNYIRDNLELAGDGKVRSLAGSITSYERRFWGIPKERADGDRHHAVDAAIIAATTEGNKQKISNFAKFKETRYTTHSEYCELKQRIEKPWEGFDADVIKMADEIFVSRRADHRIKGAAHEDTIRSVRDGLLVVRTSVSKLKIATKDDEKGEIAGYYNKQDDRLLYDALKAQLLEHGKIIEPFYKPKADGSPGPRVKTVKTCKKSAVNVEVRGGAAKNEKMLRVDVFDIADGRDKGYYFVPIYVSDRVEDALPTRASVAGKPYEQWKEMDEENFMFSLYSRDLIKITHKNQIKLSLAQKESKLPPEKLADTPEYFYYIGADTNTASISFITHDGAYKTKGIGVKTLLSIEKYQVDVLGNISPAPPERRRKTFREELAEDNA
ncbi:CRISPR-associated endonuclease Cas9 [Clostridia bacterium]|nr:CRISPR-associated endonuclease Cas9 [Clostridia bacterium]